MGCSSSSAQTVDQEKRPGTKPEEANGDTLAVKNGIIAEDAQIVEAQMLLPVQTAPPEDPKVGTENEEGAVLVAMEAQEDLGSGEDLLAASEPQSEPAASPAERGSAEHKDAGAEVQAEASDLVVPAAEQAPAVTPLVVEETPAKAAAEAPDELAAEALVEVQAEAAAEQAPAVTPLVVEETPAKAAAEAPAAALVEAPSEPSAEAPAELAAEALVEVQAEAAAEQEPAVTPLVVEETPVKGAAEAPVEAPSEPTVEGPASAEAAAEQEPAVTPSVEEESPAETAAKAPAEEAPQAEETTDHPAPETASGTPTGNEPHECSAADEAPTPGVVPAPTEPSEPADAAELLIDPAVAAATIPELPPPSSSSSSSSAQAEPESATKEAPNVSTAHSETAPPEEALCPTEVAPSPPPETESAAKQVQTLQVPAPALTASETLSQAAAEPPPGGETSESTAEAPAVETILVQSEDPSAASEPSEVVPADETSQDSERETVKKED